MLFLIQMNKLRKVILYSVYKEILSNLHNQKSAVIVLPSLIQQSSQF